MHDVLISHFLVRKGTMLYVVVKYTMAILGQLFLSRGLYWEVSSLSSTTLPFHGVQSFASMKFRNTTGVFNIIVNNVIISVN